METVHTCPLGGVCEEAKNGKIYRCAWYAKTGNVDEDTGQFIPGSERDVCSIPMIGIHLTELKKRTLGVQGSVEGLRNIVAGGSAEAQKKIDRAIEDQKRLS
jgi:hypothetical protein